MSFFHEATLDLPDFVSTLVLLHLSFNCSVLENANHTLKWVIIAPLSVRLIACKEEEEGKKKSSVRKKTAHHSFIFLSYSESPGSLWIEGEGMG